MSPSLVRCTVSVDVKHHVYLLNYLLSGLESRSGGNLGGISVLYCLYNIWLRLVSLDCTIYLLGVGVFTTELEVSRLIGTCIYVHYLRLGQNTGHAWVAPSIITAVTDLVTATADTAVRNRSGR